MPHPIQIVGTDERRLSRLTVLFRLVLAIPHFIVLSLWSIGAAISIVFAWLIALVTGHVPVGLHAFIASWVRYSAQVHAYLYLLANPYPRFSGTDPYVVDLEIAPAAHQNRLKTLFRPILVIPAAIVAGVLFLLGLVVAILGWLAALVLGRMPNGLRATGLWVLRVGEQTLAYSAMLTARYPQLGPRPKQDAQPLSSEWSA